MAERVPIWTAGSSPSCLALILITLCPAAVAWADVEPACQEPDAPGLVHWAELEFQAEKWGLAGEIVVGRSRLPGPRGERKPAWLLESTSGLLGRVSRQAVYFRDDGQVLESSSIRRSGQSSFSNLRSWETGGIRRVRRSPKSSRDADLPAGEWAEDFRRVEPLPEGHERCAAVADPLQILHHLGPQRDLPECLCFAVSDRAVRIEVEEVLPTPNLRRVLRSLPGSLLDETERTASLRVSIVGSERSDFELLGLHDLVLTYGRRSGLPLVVTGTLPRLGTLQVILQAHRAISCDAE